MAQNFKVLSDLDKVANGCKYDAQEMLFIKYEGKRTYFTIDGIPVSEITMDIAKVLTMAQATFLLENEDQVKSLDTLRLSKE